MMHNPSVEEIKFTMPKIQYQHGEDVNIDRSHEMAQTNMLKISQIHHPMNEEP